MVDYRKLLDAVVGAIGRPDQHKPAQSGRGEVGRPVGKGVTPTAGHSPDQLLQKAKDFAMQHPGLTQTALVGLGGPSVQRPQEGQADRQSGQARRPRGDRRAGLQGVPEPPGQGNRRSRRRSGVSTEAAVAQSTISLPETSRFHPVSQTEDDALLFLRTMVAAAAADGHIDQAERARIVKGLTEAGIDPESSRWLETEMASPADVDELAENVNDPEMAAQVYAAARIAIDPDTIQEREFLHQLADALDLDPEVRTQIDETAGALS